MELYSRNTYGKSYPSGLRVCVKKIEGLLSVTMGVLVGTGSSWETPEENGISHFIEHMMFKGTAKRNAFEISDSMDRIGAQINAFTAKEMTCYYAKCTSDHTAEAFEILSDYVLHSVFPEDEMEREKGVVLEEIAMGEDTPDDLCLEVLAEAYHGDEGYGRTILGPASNVRGFSRVDLDRYIAERYAPENIVISFAGAVEPDEADALVERYFECDMKKRGLPDRARPYAVHTDSLFRRKEIEQTHIALGFPAFAREDPLFDASQVLNVVLGGGMSSRLFQRVREQMGLAYTVYSYLTAYTEGGLLTVYAGVSPKNTEKALGCIFDTLKILSGEGITETEFSRGKEQLKSSMILGQESTSSQMLQYGRYLLLNGRMLDYEKRIGDIVKLTPDDCRKVLETGFARGACAAAVVGRTDAPLSL